MNWVFAACMFGIAVFMSITGLVDLAVMLAVGSRWTLSKRISDWVGEVSPGYVWLLMFMSSASYMLGMLVTHFCNFRMG